uniref:Bm10438 n=1 Tax=Brugia malayi TaxID=6279 RepID=A0A0J9XYW5_BRUMA|nr:Bm10438 [Brugia malayi]
MNAHSAHSEFYFKALIKGISYEINSQGETVKQPASRTRLQICNLPPLELPTAVDNFVYVRITNIESGVKKFFGTLERNRFLLDDLQKMLDDIRSANCKSVFDPAVGEIVLVKDGERFVRGCVVCKTHFMTCTTYLIDSGLTMEIGLEQLYVINEELLKIPPQAFLMLLDVDIEQPLISIDELSAMVKNTVVAFRLKNGEAFVGAMIMRNQNGEICDLRNILLEGVHSANISHEIDKSIIYAHQMQDAAIYSNRDYDTILSDEYSLSEHSSIDFEDERSVISLCLSEKFEEENDECIVKQLVLSGNHWRAILLPTENSGPGLFYLHFLDGPAIFEDLIIYSSSLFGKYSNIWYRLLKIPGLQYDIKDDRKFVQVDNTVGSYSAFLYGGKQVDEKLRNQLKATFACRLSCSAPKPFNHNRYSNEAKSYFTEKLTTNHIFDVHIVKVLPKCVLEVEILLPGGESLFDKLCELDFAQPRWTWKIPSYNFESINEEQLVQRTDDEDDVHMTFTVQIENKQNDLIEFQKHLKPSKHVLRNPEIGDICIVECEGQQFRCEIVDMTDEKKSFIVNYVDYGEEQELNGDSLYSVDNQEEIVFETPVFGIKCRLEEIRPIGKGLDIQTGAWSRKALKLINSVVPLNKKFKAIIGPPDSLGIHPVRVVEGTLLRNDLATTLVLNNLAMYTRCNYYSSAINLSTVENLEVQYLNVEDGIIYGIPSIFKIWLQDCQNHLEKVWIYEVKKTYKEDTRGIILYKNKYRRVIRLHEENKSLREAKKRYFLIDEGRTVEFHGNSEMSSIISFSALEDPHAAFFLRTCPALAVGFILRGKKLESKHEKLLKNICCEKENVHLNVGIVDRKKNDLYSIGDVTFTDGSSLVNLLDDSAEVFSANEFSPTNKFLLLDQDNLWRNDDQCKNDTSFCCEDFFSNVDLFKEY